MDTIYISKKDLEKALLKQKYCTEIESNCSIGIASISDLIELIEVSRKDSTDITELLCKRYEEESGGKVFIAELDQNLLSKNLFDDEIWNEFSSSLSNPMSIIRHVSLKRCDESIWWSENVYYEMRNLYA